MKHATAPALRQLDDLLLALRALGMLREPRPGCFYRQGTAFLHFHEDPSGLFADVKLAPGEFTRLPASSAAQRAHILAAVRRTIASWPPPKASRAS